MNPSSFASLNDAGISASQSNDIPADLTLSGIQQKVLLLANELRISGNLEIFEEIQQLSDGVWSEDWIRIAQVGNQLSQDYDFRRDLPSNQLTVPKPSPIPSILKFPLFMIPSCSINSMEVAIRQSWAVPL